MIVRFGYVAMSIFVQNASPSKTMTATQFAKLEDREAAIAKLERIAAENIHNTLRLLRHNKAYDIRLYRLSSKLIPLFGHELLGDWDPIAVLETEFRELGEYVRENRMRLSFHPDHFTVLSTPRREVFEASVRVLERHMAMLNAMGLDENAKCNIHIGGTYGDKEKSLERFVSQFAELAPAIRRRITLENDDKTYTAKETLEASTKVGVPMVLDLHHHFVNSGGDSIQELWPRILETWEGVGIHPEASIGLPQLPPKIHISSPRDGLDVRAHADHVDPGPLAQFMREIAGQTPYLDVMIEAKNKDGALFQLMKELPGMDGITAAGQASIIVEG